MRLAPILTALLIAVLLIGPGAAPSLADSLQIGKDYYELRRFTDALSALKKAVQENPKNWEAYFYTAKIYQESSQPDLALRYYMSAWRAKPGNDNIGKLLDESYLRKAGRARAENGAEGAIRELENALKQGFFSVAVANQLLTLYGEQQKFESMIRVAEEVLRRQATFSLFPRNGEGTKRTHFLLGRACYETRDYEKAMEHLETAFIHREPGAQEYYQRTQEALARKAKPFTDQGEQLYREGKMRQARTSFEKALELHKDNPFARKMILKIDNVLKAQDLETQAGTAVSEGRADDAIGLLREALLLYPENTRLQKQIQAIQQRRAELEASRRAREVALRRERQEKQQAFADHIEAARGFKKAGQYARAQDAYRLALKVFPDDRNVAAELEGLSEKVETERRYRAAVAAFKGDDWAEAIKDFRALSESRAEGFKGINRYLALAYLKIRRIDEFENYASLSLKENPDDVDLLYLWSSQAASNPDSTTRLKEALAGFKHIETISPGYKDAADQARRLHWQIYWPQYAIVVALILGYILVYFFVKQRPKLMKRLFLKDLERVAAKADWTAAMEMQPMARQHDLDSQESVQVHSLLARAFFEGRQPSRAITEVQKALRHNPRNKELRILLARAFYANKTISSDILEYYMDLLEVEQDNRQLLSFVGGFCTDKKILNPTTMSLMRQLAQVEPENDKVRNLLLRGYLKDGDRSSTAMALYRVERERNPENLDVRVIMAEEQLKKKNFEKVIQECEEMLNINLTHPKVHELMVNAYKKQDRMPDLIKNYQAILEVDPHNTFIQSHLARLTGPGSGAAASGAVNPPASLSDPGPAASGPPAAAVEAPVRGTQNCPSCGSEVSVGTYFCSCGSPL